MNAGDLRTRATLQRRVETDNDDGGKTITYATVGALWCQDVSLQGTAARVLRDAQRITATLTHAIRIRYTTTVTPTMRLTLGRAVLTVASVAELDQKRSGLMLLCEEVLPNG